MYSLYLKSGIGSSELLCALEMAPVKIFTYVNPSIGCDVMLVNMMTGETTSTMTSVIVKIKEITKFVGKISKPPNYIILSTKDPNNSKFIAVIGMCQQIKTQGVLIYTVYNCYQTEDVILYANGTPVYGADMIIDLFNKLPK